MQLHLLALVFCTSNNYCSH